MINATKLIVSAILSGMVFEVLLYQFGLIPRKDLESFRNDYRLRVMHKYI